MKKLHLWSMLVVTMMASVCVALSSCGGDDDSDDNSPAANLDLTGTWMCTGSIDSWDGGSKTDLMVGKILVVKADNTYTSTSSNMGNGAYTLLGNKLTAISTTGKVITATVSLSGNKLEMEGTTNDGVRFIYTFKRVTDDNGGGTGEASMMKEWMEKPLGNVNVSLKTGSYQAIKNGVAKMYTISKDTVDSDGEPYFMVYPEENPSLRSVRYLGLSFCGAQFGDGGSYNYLFYSFEIDKTAAQNNPDSYLQKIIQDFKTSLGVELSPRTTSSGKVEYRGTDANRNSFSVDMYEFSNYHFSIFAVFYK